MPDAALRRGLANMLICTAGFFGTFIVVCWLVSLTTDNTPSESREIAFAIIWTGSMLAFVVSWIHGFSCRGSRLLDCGAPPKRWLFVITAVLFGIEGIRGSFGRSYFTGQSGRLYALLFSVFWIMMSLGRLEIHERGIWAYSRLMKWSRIKDYSWAEDGTLLISESGPLSFLRRGAIHVPNECLAEFIQLLEQRLSATLTR
jgi:hypothetical protein